jgi:hypothetical protein
MRRGLACSALLATAVATLLAVPASTRALSSGVPQLPALQRFLATDHGAVHQAVTVRHLEARNEHFDADAWMDVRTEADADGFRYTVLDEGGSGLVRSKALRGALEQEKRAWASGDGDRAWFTADNYEFEDGGLDEDGLARIGITPRRKDLLLVTGSIFLKPEDGQLVRIEGTPAKSPSFWTRRIHITRHYARIAGIQVPVVVESNAQIRIAGRSTFKMVYTYETVNGLKVE